jgi:hypothetical protein
MRLDWLAGLVALAVMAGCGGKSLSHPDAGGTENDAGTVDWPLTFDLAATSGPLPASLLGFYDLSGELYHYDQVEGLPALMKPVGFAEWRIGLGRWEFGTQLLPTLTDGSSCAAALQGTPPGAFAPAGTTDLDLIAARDWFTYTDGGPVGVADTADDSRYMLAYVRSNLDVTSAFGAEPYLNIDHMPRALAANQTPERLNSDWPGACATTWTNKVSNVAPANLSVFAAAAAGLVQRVVEGSGGEAGRPVRYWSFWNEPEGAYAWNPEVASFMVWLETADLTLLALDAYRTRTTNADGQAIRIGLGELAAASDAAIIVSQLNAPFDFISFHSYQDDPLAVVADIETVATARAASALHPSVELALSEWGPALTGSTLDATKMDVALHNATVLALGAAAGLTHAHHSTFWQPTASFNVNLDLLFGSNQQFTLLPAYHAYTLLAAVIGSGRSRLEPAGAADGKLDQGLGAVLASLDSSGVVRVLLINRESSARTATVGAIPTAVTVFDDPTRAPYSVSPTEVVTVPASSLVLIER